MGIDSAQHSGSDIGVSTQWQADYARTFGGGSPLERRVRVRKYLEVGHINGLYCSSEMVQRGGEIVTITETTPQWNGPHFRIREDDGQWNWNSDMFEVAEPTEEVRKIKQSRFKIVMTKEKEELVEVNEEANKEGKE